MRHSRCAVERHRGRVGSDGHVGPQHGHVCISGRQAVPLEPRAGRTLWQSGRQLRDALVDAWTLARTEQIFWGPPGGALHESWVCQGAAVRQCLRGLLLRHAMPPPYYRGGMAQRLAKAHRLTRVKPILS